MSDCKCECERDCVDCEDMEESCDCECNVCDCNEENDELTVLQKELQESKKQLLTLAAEYENFRKRTEREKAAIYSDATTLAVIGLFPILDGFGAALKSFENLDESYKKGIVMLEEQFKSTLKALGVEEFGEVGEDFDPKLHSAVSHVDTDEKKQNFISQLFQKGYKLGEKIIRPAMVQTTN